MAAVVASSDIECVSLSLRPFSDLMDSWFDSFPIPKITCRLTCVGLSVCLSGLMRVSVPPLHEPEAAARECAVLLALISLAWEMPKPMSGWR